MDTRTTHVALGPGGTLALSLELAPTRLLLTLEGGEKDSRWRRARRPRVELDWGPAGGDGFTRMDPGARWNLSPLGGTFRDEQPDCFRDFVQLATSALDRAWSVAGDESLRASEDQLLLSAVDGARRHALSRLEPGLKALANRFAPSNRWAVYRALAADGTGRLAQLAASAPGALSFALAHVELGDEQMRTPALAFREAALAGTPLNRALGPLLEDWAAHHHVLLGASRDEKARRMADQRLLVRRALACIDAQVLWMPPPLSFAPEDVPGTPAGQGAWFDVAKRSSAFLRWRQGAPDEVQGALCRWVSAHAVELHAADAWVEHLAEAVLHARLRLSRGDSLKRVLSRLRTDRRDGQPLFRPARHHFEDPDTEAHAQAKELAQLLKAYPHLRVEGAPAALHLPSPFTDSSGPGWSIRALRSSSDVSEEGRQMQHCAGSLVANAASGSSFFFHADTPHGPLTVEVQGPAHAPRLSAAFGPKNRQPTREQEELLHAWWTQQASALGVPALVRPAPRADPLLEGDVDPLDLDDDTLFYVGEMPEVPF